MGKTITLGLIEGAGTGIQLANIFKNVIQSIAKKEAYSNKIEFLSFINIFGYPLESYCSLKHAFMDKEQEKPKEATQRDLNNMHAYFDVLEKKQPLGVFRTAINAETLYQFRAKEKIVKCVPLTISNKERTTRLLILRDQIQGYYANQDMLCKKNSIDTTASFSKENFVLMLDFLQKQCKKIQFPLKKIVFIYKYHIFGLNLEKLIDSSISHAGLTKIPRLIYQPDSGIKYLLENSFCEKEQDIVVLCSNEVGDMLLEMLIYYYKKGNNENIFTQNYILTRNNLEILQTMHGSADDLSNTNTVNPAATLHACAYALENWLGIASARQKMNSIILSENHSYNNFSQKVSDTNNFVENILKKWP